MSKLGPASHRGSTGSHQSIRVTLKNPSIKCHRRTGSLAEAKRVSMLSKHTAFSSPMVSAGGVGLSCRGRGSPSFCSLPTLIFSDDQNSLFFNHTHKPRPVCAPQTEAVWPIPLSTIVSFLKHFLCLCAMVSAAGWLPGEPPKEVTKRKASQMKGTKHRNKMACVKRQSQLPAP